MPFRYELYDDRGGGNIGALMMAPAQARARALREAAMAQARAAEVRGANTANAIGSIGQIIQGGIQGYQQEKADAPRREMEALQLRAARGQMQGAEVEAAREQRREAAFTDLLSRGTMPDPREILTIYGPERGSKIADGLQAFASLQTKQVTDARDTAGRLAIGFKQFSPQLQAQFWPAIRQAAITGGLGDAQTIPEQPTSDFLDGVIAWAKGEQPKQEGFTLSPGQQRFGPDGQPIATVEPKPEPEKTFTVTVPGPNGRPVRKVFTESQLREGVAEYREPQAASTAQEPLVAVMGPDNRPVLVRRSQAEGKAPASTREQGRPVTSGDAGRIVDFDTALDDLKVLDTTLTETAGATGTAAKIGASMPNWATDTFGWGTDAKKRQGVIDRVKQVIGKALEGGVLRKEDEIKYAKILPTIGDTPEVAASKLRGLSQAIQLRRQRQIDALEDAGYDVGRFRQRAGGGDPLGILK